MMHATCNLGDFELGIGAHFQFDDARTELHKAVDRGHLEIVKKLLSPTADVPLSRDMDSIRIGPDLLQGEKMMVSE